MMKSKRFLAFIVCVAVIISVIPGYGLTIFAAAPSDNDPTVIQSDTKENSNQAGGIVYTKTSTAKSDGTIDITLTAHTTGVVKQLNTVTPTDIVLVLDTSGSMNYEYDSSSVTTYADVLGDAYTYTTGVLFWTETHTGYGFNSGSRTRYYINTGTASAPVYTQVSRTGRDSNGYEYFEYSSGNDSVYVYPKLESGVAGNRANDYDVYQFYSATTTTTERSRMDVLKSAVDSFIDTTMTMNEGLDEAEMHTITVVKFADDSYYDGYRATSTLTTVTGNNKNNNGYNYSQVVKKLVPVDADGAAELKAAVNSLEPGGATSVDFGINLAEAVLMERSTVVAEGAVDRNEVVIVFTDGEPNHQSGFDEDVANDAIAVAGRMESTAGVTVYGVSVDANADETDISANINKFMHYMSSNYPNAENMDTPGAGGDMAAGYYMTPHGDMTLTMIFDAIIHEIDHPTVSMGEEATMVDTISPYFDFANGSAAEVKLQTSARNADGTWADPVDDASLTYTIEKDRLTVDGFDFDANYVSETGRGDNKNFYGKRLVVSFTVVPDYDVIDAASATLMDGVLPTNSGFAALNDSDENAAAEVETPELFAHQVTYMVDGKEYTTYQRFTGSDVEVDAVPTKTGYVFSGWSYPSNITVSSDEFTMPDEDVVITGEFTPAEYNVRYQYSGKQPEGAPTLPAAHTADYNSTVTVAAPLEFEGYVFRGWNPLQTDVKITEDGKFTMPAKDVTLVGYFESSTSTPYMIEHYLETLTDGVYEADPVFVEDGLTGTTGATVTAVPLNRFTGFEYNAAESASTISGVIKADGSLVLEVYYDRIEYNVTYGYDGDTNIDDLPTLPTGGTYKYGQTVTVADKAVPPAGYTFTGWYRGTVDNAVEGTFTMPAFDVHLLGYFTANSGTEYNVEHYLMDVDGEYADTPAVTENYTGTTGETVTAAPLPTFEGFTYNAGESTASGTVAGDGSLVLKLYYDRNQYKVTYQYEGTVPTGASELPAQSTHAYGEKITVADQATAPAGYTFTGWYRGEVTNIVTEIIMPARDVVLTGYFKPNSGTEYNVEHYLMDTDGKYASTPAVTATFTGTTGETVTATPLSTFEGFTYNAGESTASGTVAGDGSLVLKLYYDRNQYKVTYEYEGTVPTGASELPAQSTHAYGEKITVADQATAPAGYAFVGWYSGEVTNIVTEITMPNRDVILRGYFKPGEKTPYAVHHYLETLTDGVYETTPALVEDNFSGTTGNTVTATPLNRFTGFKYNEAKSAKTITGVIAGDGSLILKVYYDREQYKVTYGYEGVVPENPPALPSGGTYDYGAAVTVAGKVTAPAGYTFVGWYRGTEDKHVEETFNMPAYDVHLLGNFTVNTNTPYRVEHYLQNVTGSGYTLDGSGETRHGITGTSTSALPREYPGFTYNDSISTESGTIAGDGSLVLKFYYDRNTYDITYVYEGIVPEGTPTAPDAVSDVRYGTKVTLEDEPSTPGYIFSGWTTADAEIDGDEFIMPDKDVVLKGSFMSDLVEYEVNYWFQKVDAGSTFNKADYVLDDDSYTREAYTGQHVEADPKSHTGFSVNTEHSKSYGHVTVDKNGIGNLVLDIYFDRHTYDVTYGYYGEQPEGAPDLSGKNRTNVRYGTVLDVESKPTLDEYAFDGWYTHTAAVDNGKFTMPDHNVEFLGRFVKQYSVSYDLNGGFGDYGVDYSTVMVDAGEQITVKAAPSRSGYAFDGWKEATERYTPRDKVTVERNMTFVAQWVRDVVVVPQYTLTYVTNGGNHIPSESYDYGTTVSLTKVPVREGYIFEGWYIDKALAESVTSVVMTKDITVYANWVKDNGSGGNGHETPEGLNGDDHFAYVIGYTDGTVRPDANISRSEVAAIFFRLLKPEIRDKNLSYRNYFTDVSTDDWYNIAVSTLVKLGIIKGRTETEFVADVFITRAEFASVCARFDISGYDVVDNFTDIEGHWAEDDIHKAASNGWIKGYEDGTFRPDQPITRAEAMTMINRVLNRVPETADDLLPDMITWPDNLDKNKWYYLAVQEATNSHDYKMKNHIYETWTAIRPVTDWTKYE